MSVGPDYKTPPVPDTMETSVQKKAQEFAKQTSTPSQISAQMLAGWWNTLNDPMLTNYITKALSQNLDLQTAQAKVRESRARLGMAQGAYFPELDVSGSYSKTRTSENVTILPGGSQQTNLYSAGFDASWELDVFGGTRRSVEAARADLAASAANLQAVWVSLAAEVAQNYVLYRTSQEALRVAKANLVAQTETYEILSSRFSVGLSDALAVQQAKYNMENTRAAIPVIEVTMEERLNALSVLVGEMPGNLAQEMAAQKPIPKSPVQMVTGIPAEAMRKRPDIRRAERELAAQTARIGVATADLYPKFYLFGTIGLESIDNTNLFDSKSLVYSILPKITWPIFRGGTIRSNIAVQTALQEQALAQYEKTLLVATQEVRNALTAYNKELGRNESLILAVAAAKDAQNLAMDRYKNGLSDFNNVLEAQRSLLTLQEQQVRSDGNITTYLVQLYKALGGGWEVLTEAQLKAMEKASPVIGAAQK